MCLRRDELVNPIPGGNRRPASQSEAQRTLTEQSHDVMTVQLDINRVLTGAHSLGIVPNLHTVVITKDIVQFRVRRTLKLRYCLSLSASVFPLQTSL